MAIQEIDKVDTRTSGIDRLTTADNLGDLSAQEQTLIRKIMAQQDKLPELNLVNTPSLKSRASVGEAPSTNATTELLDAVEQYRDSVKATLKKPNRPLEFPCLAQEALNLGLAKENLTNKQIGEHLNKINASQKQISLLLDLHAELNESKEENNVINDKANALMQELKTYGIELKGKDVGDIKRSISSHESRLRSEVQIIFSTEVQHLMQQVESLIQILQNIIRSDAKLKENILQKMSR